MRNVVSCFEVSPKNSLRMTEKEPQEASLRTRIKTQFPNVKQKLSVNDNVWQSCLIRKCMAALYCAVNTAI
jgi:hypothetical protein